MQTGGCSCVNSNRHFVFFHFLNIKTKVMPNSRVLGKETWESLDSERVKTRVSCNTIQVKNEDEREREPKDKEMALKKPQRGKEGDRGEKREPGKREGHRNITPARWLLRHGGDNLGCWFREETTLEASLANTRDIWATEKPNQNIESKNKRKTKGSIRAKTIERCEKGMKKHRAIQNRDMVSLCKLPDRSSNVNPMREGTQGEMTFGEKN